VSVSEQREVERREGRARKEAIERVTEIADELLASGLASIYHTSFEALQASTASWQYKVQLRGK
jgi:hypothetical protein